MNRLSLLLALLVFCATAVYSQSPIEVTTKDGRIVILKPDGTWEFKNPPPQPTPSPNDTSNVSRASSLGANFSGHDTNALYSKLQDLRERFVKSEFETTAQYESRIQEETKSPLIDSLTVRDVFSLVVSNIESNYDADTQKMRYFIPVRQSPRAKLSRLAGRSEEKRTSRDLTDFNLYSLALNTDRYRISEVSICFDELNGLPLSGETYNAGFSADVPLNVEEAKRLKNSTRAVVVVRFLEPFVAAGNILTGKQFQVRLIDVLFFDPETGKVLARLKQSTK